MREIKFRWVGVIDGESEARPHAVVGIHWGAMVVELEGDEGCTYPIAAGSLVQFTGLTDSEGREVYEGDITSHGYAIRYNDEKALFAEHNNRGSIMSYPIGGFPITIIGNIHENPELLEAP